MGDWYLDHNGKWQYDHLAPNPGDNPDVTSMLPVIPPSPRPRTVDAGGVVDPAEFDSFDDVDSRTIVDPGAPA